MFRFGIVLSVLSMLVCFNAFAGQKIDKLFTPDLIYKNITVAHVEGIVGKPTSIVDDPTIEVRIYSVEGCDLEIYDYTKGHLVAGYTLQLSDKCSFNLGAFFQTQEALSTKDLTLSVLENEAAIDGLKVMSYCVVDCHTDGIEINFVYTAPHFMNYTTFTFSIDTSGPEGLWTDTMAEKAGNSYITGKRFNCDDKFDAQANEQFARAVFAKVTIGYHPWVTPKQTSCGLN
jgi:hypothetical protein